MTCSFEEEAVYVEVVMKTVISNPTCLDILNAYQVYRDLKNLLYPFESLNEIGCRPLSDIMQRSEIWTENSNRVR